MISREWLNRWLGRHLTAAAETHVIPEPVIIDGLSRDLLERWLEGESAFWHAASQKRGLTTQQRAMRVQVGRFYDQRLASIRATTPPTEEP